MRLFLASELIEFVAMDTVALFWKLYNETSIFITTDYYSKLARAIQTLKTTVSNVTNVFMSRWLISYGIPAYLQIGSRTRHVSDFFTAMCALLGMKDLTITPCHPQTNGLAEQFNKTILHHLKYYVTERKKE